MSRTLHRVAPALALVGTLSCVALSATAAAAEPYPWHQRFDDASALVTQNKAPIEHRELLVAAALRPNKAQIEHGERIAAMRMALAGKAQIEYWERVAAAAAQTKAQVEHRERLAELDAAPATRHSSATPLSWELGGFGALGIAGVTLMLAVPRIDTIGH